MGEFAEKEQSTLLQQLLSGHKQFADDELDQLLIDELLNDGKLDESSLARAAAARRDSRDSLRQILLKLGLVSERDLAYAISEILGKPVLKETDYPQIALDLPNVSIKFLRAQKVVPFKRTDIALDCAMADPFDLSTIKALQIATQTPILPWVGLSSDIDTALQRLYVTEEADTTNMPGEGQVLADEDVSRLRDLASEAPVIRLVNALIERAVSAHASDVHLESFRGRVSVRLRVDGELVEIDPPTNDLRAAILSRIKIMANLNIAERRVPQDGRLKTVVRGRDIDLRVSVLPAMHGECVVLRILDRGELQLDLESLGFSEHASKRYRSALNRSNGITLITGPTGSGKTSTLYASLTELASPKRKIITVEDPIEYELPGVVQIQTKSEIDLGFAQILRSVLRHDPEVLMIGEIRDKETAEIAIQSALTGHTVLSTLHTNSASAAIARLLDMGIEDYLIATTLNAVVGQRLVQKLCDRCKQPYRPSKDLLAPHGKTSRLSDRSFQLYRAAGCEQCSHRGYAGRIAIAEVLSASGPIRKAITSSTNTTEIEATAIDEGMISMFADGWDKAEVGITTLEEVLRVTDAAYE